MAFTSCFVIAPIGKDGTDVRKRSDNLFKFVIAPAATAAGFSKLFRADHLDHPGSITHQVLQHLRDIDVVIADLSDQNPNVFYEAGIAHTLGKTVIPITQSDQDIPFDLRHHRYLTYLCNIEGLSDLSRSLGGRLQNLSPNERRFAWDQS